MGKFGNAPTRKTGVLRTTEDRTLTYEGDSAWSLGPVDELFSMLVTSFVEPKFYEKADEHLERLRRLTKEATDEDSVAVALMAKWARKEGNMRSAPIVVACEYAKAGGPAARSVINDVCQRADEPGEILGYWLWTYGKPIPGSVKRGVADAVRRLYNELSTLRYDSSGNRLRFGDVIELVHPKPKDDAQSTLFKHLLDRGHGHSDRKPNGLPMLELERNLQRLAPSQRRKIDSDTLREAGFSWERYSAWILGSMDAQAWETILPSMGYMAILRNLRNFEEAGISARSKLYVEEVLTNPAQVARSRQLPFRFWSAYKNTNTMMFAAAIEKAMDIVFEQAPRLDGRTLILVDVSGSMSGMGLSRHSKTKPIELASVFGAAVAKSTGGNCKLVAFASGNGVVNISPNMSVLRMVDGISHINDSSQLGHSTQFWDAIRTHYDDSFDRVVVLTDMQFHPRAYGWHYDGKAPIYFWDLSGYGRVPERVGEKHWLFTGISDKAFDMVRHIEGRANGNYPWQD